MTVIESKQEIRDNITHNLCYLDTQMQFEFIKQQWKPNFNNNALVAAINIFSFMVLDRMVTLQYDEKIDIEDRYKMGEKLIEDIGKVLHTYTGVKLSELNER